MLKFALRYIIGSGWRRTAYALAAITSSIFLHAFGYTAFLPQPVLRFVDAYFVAQVSFDFAFYVVACALAYRLMMAFQFIVPKYFLLLFDHKISDSYYIIYNTICFFISSIILFGSYTNLSPVHHSGHNDPTAIMIYALFLALLAIIVVFLFALTMKGGKFGKARFLKNNFGIFYSASVSIFLLSSASLGLSRFVHLTSIGNYSINLPIERNPYILIGYTSKGYIFRGYFGEVYRIVSNEGGDIAIYCSPRARDNLDFCDKEGFPDVLF